MYQKVAQFIYSDHCYKQYIENSNESEQCFMQAATTVLGFIVMFLSVFLKVPQLLKITKNRSAKGINMKAMSMELFALTAGVSYAYSNGYPFSSWGEGMFLALQQFVIVSLLLHYGSSTKKSIMFIACYTTAVATVAVRLIPVNALWMVQACNLPLLLSGKFFQFSTNYKSGGTGQLSALTTALTVFVCAVRIFTSFITTGDKLIILIYSIAMIGNVLILGQVVWYWNTDKDGKKRT